jgi:hypothetical protein
VRHDGAAKHQEPRSQSNERDQSTFHPAPHGLPF